MSAVKYKCTISGSVSYTPVEMSTAWQTSRDYNWHPTEPGVYNFIVYGRDATYNTVIYKSITYLVKPPL